MPNTKLIKSQMVKEEKTIQMLANEMGLSAYTLGQKLSGKAPLTIREARAIQRLLSIEDKDIPAYFFD